MAELMFAHVALQAGERVLDAVCGTGIVARVAAQRFGHLAQIIGVDLNPGMLEMARAPYARDVAAVEEDVRQAIGWEVSAALQAYRDGDEVVIPHRSHLVRDQAA